MNEFTHFRVPDVYNYDVDYYFQVLSQIKSKRIFPLHMHDKMEIYILIEGDVSFVVESSLYRLSPGDAIVTKPNERHHCILNNDSVHRHACFQFDPSNEFLFADFLAHDFGQNNLIIPDDASKVRLLQIYDKISAAEEENDTHKKFFLTLEMLSIFRRFVFTDSAPQTLPEVLKEILNDIDRNFRSIHSLDYFIEKYYISASTLNRLFRTYLHTTPKTYLETKRLAHSRLLLKSGKSVLAACMESGFPDYSNYIRLFKKRFSITPKQYKDN